MNVFLQQSRYVLSKQHRYDARRIPETLSFFSRSFSNNKHPDSTELYQSFHDQLKELEDERIEIFGTNESSHVPSNKPVKSDMELEIDEMNKEREHLYAFTKEEKVAWGSSNSMSMKTELLEAVKGAREAKASHEKSMETEINEKVISIAKQADEKLQQSKSFLENKESSITENNVDPVKQPFTHLNSKGDKVTMVDVGKKVITRRVATARSAVVFPPEVMDAFGITSTGGNDEMIGKKGPIFSTARLAGIMGAKRTSDLIPLCHPLPLDKVNIDIKLEGNRAVIECECSVTYKTGVEMEALTGASVAALTIYDMVKAVSHRIRIENTELITKTGGKRNIEDGLETKNNLKPFV